MSIISEISEFGFAKAFYYKAIEVAPANFGLHVDFFRRHKYWPNFTTPKTFSEKIYKRKIESSLSNIDMIQLTDKITAKEHVSKILGEKWINPTLWSGDCVDEVPDNILGLNVAIKSNYGSGMNLFFENLHRNDLLSCREQTLSWMSRVWPQRLAEDWYNHINKKILIEPLLTTKGEELPDYKFLVFRGKVRFIQVDFARFGRHQRTLFSCDWNRLPYNINSYPPISSDISAPKCLHEMIEAAETLANNNNFARIDFYDVNGTPIFGEITFTPGAGQSKIYPRTMDDVMGDWWG